MGEFCMDCNGRVEYLGSPICRSCAWRRRYNDAAADLTREKDLHHQTLDKLDRVQADAANGSKRLLSIAGACNSYFNGPDHEDGQTARRALRVVADALGQPWDDTPASKMVDLDTWPKEHGLPACPSCRVGLVGLLSVGHAPGCTWTP